LLSLQGNFFAKLVQTLCIASCDSNCAPDQIVNSIRFFAILEERSKAAFDEASDVFIAESSDFFQLDKTIGNCLKPRNASKIVSNVARRSHNRNSHVKLGKLIVIEQRNNVAQLPQQIPLFEDEL